MKRNQRGFTIIELMIATMAFSIILLIASSTVVQIGKLYYKGIVQSKTQETAREVSDEITRSFQFAAGRKVDVPFDASKPDQTQFCINDTRYTYQINKKIGSGTFGLKAYRLGAADTCAGPADGKELLGSNMRLLRFEVQSVGGSDKVFRINMRIAYGDNDLLDYYPSDANDTTAPTGDPGGGHCRSGISGSNFCAVAELDNVVKKRLNLI